MNDPVKLLDWIYARRPWEDGLSASLRRYGFEEPQKAWQNLITLAGQLKFPDLFPDFFPALMQAISKSYSADIALHNLERFAGKIFDKNYLYTLLTDSPELLEALIILFSGSQVLTDTLLKDPSHFDWLRQPETLGKSKSKDALMRDFHEMAEQDTAPGKVPRLLRRFKKRECIRIGLRDLLGKVEMQETVEDLSNLADVCLQVAYEHEDRELRKKYGVPIYQAPDGHWKVSEFTILGMGKLGGKELNYSSDIDLIYIYTSSKGETRAEDPHSGPFTQVSNHEYFTKLAQRITTTLNEITEEGNVFRVDLNLRPEGRSGEIANSLASCEVYYQSWGQTWERQALLKARIAAGSVPLGKEFLSLMEPFIYRRSLDFSAIEEIKSMKKKIDLDLKGKKTGKGHIKLGFGGIREIEFIVQAYQLIFGGQNPDLRVVNTLKLMEKLRSCGFLTEEDFRHLKEAYIFLRNLENRVQISFGLQTHVLPVDEARLSVLARKMRLKGRSRKDLAARLMEEFERHTRFAGNMFANLFAGEKKQEAAEIAEAEPSPSAPGESGFSPKTLASRGFADPDRTFRFLKSLRDGPPFSHPSEKSIQDFYTIIPNILDHSTRVPKPDDAIQNLEKFVSVGAARETTLSLFQANPKFLELLLILFGSSDFLSQILVRQPGLVDILMDMEAIYRFKPPEKIAEDWRKMLDSCRDLAAKKIALRRAKQGEELRVGIRYLIKEADLAGTLADLSNLADVYLQTVLALALETIHENSDSPHPPPDDFAIFGLGKLGGNELNFGSDLDLLFVHDEPAPGEPPFPPGELSAHYAALSQLIYQLTAEMTPAGFAYKIDTGLRPEGGSGALVLSIQGYEEYFKTRARIWEKQALIRTRFIAGKPGMEKSFLKVVHEFTYGEKLEYGSLIEISRLRERMEKELAREPKKGKNVKLGFGGLADIEFTLQILQLMHGHQIPRLRRTNTLETLKLCAAYGVIGQGGADQLEQSYLFLRNLECALRLLYQPFTNYLPRNRTSLAALAKLLGYEGNEGERADTLMRDYGKTTHLVRSFYRRTIDTLLRKAL
ncbi:MAG: bifunctional [glutamate--ammonia ligase]-adenylyl-L-tyrosine phosphorylase/[glutamate--ammonia-ligase] adenylyltransferase [Nitrospinaceae bacterium]